MLKKMKPLTKLTRKVKRDHHCENSYQKCLIDERSELGLSPTKKIPVGFFAVYVGEERERFIVPTRFLGHPLFKILLEKAHDEFGFEQKSGLVVPCSVSTFQEVVNAVESNHGRFDMRKFFEEFA